MISSAMTEILRLLYAEARPQLSDDCAGVLGMDHLALSVSVAGRATEQLWSSGKTSSHFEDLQFTLGEGPGPDAVRTGLLVLAHDEGPNPSPSGEAHGDVLTIARPVTARDRNARR